MADWATAAGLDPAGLIELRDPTRVAREFHGLTAVALSPPPPDATALIASGGDRLAIAAGLREAGWRVTGITHPAAVVAETASVDRSATLGPGAIVGAESAIGADAILNRGALVGHHTIIGDGATLNPGVNIGGNGRVGEGAFLGMGCTIVNGSTIGQGAVVAAGAVVVGDVSAGSRVQGVPARPHGT